MDIDERLEESIENKYMQHDKGKNKMKLTAEESFYILKRRDFNSYVEEKAIQTVLEELEKEYKIIDKLAFALADYVMYYEYDKCRNPEMIKYKAKEQIEYFTNKVEEDIK